MQKFILTHTPININKLGNFEIALDIPKNNFQTHQTITAHKQLGKLILKS